MLGLIDFYHAAKQLSDAVKLRRWSATQRTRWLNRTRGLLKRARVDEVITALRELCRGRTAGKIRTHLNYFLKNRHRFAYTTMVGLGLPRGSGAVESAIRRVINLRIKGASIYWLPESVDAILLLRSFYKSGRWNCLQRMVAASREHFSHNPFAPPSIASLNGTLRRRPSASINRRRKADGFSYLPPDNRYYKMINAEMERGQSSRNIYQLRRSYVREKKDGLCPTLTANMGIGGHNVPFVQDRWGIRRLQVDEVARFQGFDSPESLFPDIPETEQYRLLGNTVCAKLARIVGESCAAILRESSNGR